MNLCKKLSFNLITFLLTVLMVFINSTSVMAWTYQIKKGDSLFKISKRFGVSLSSLKKTNRLKNNKIKTGNKIWILDSPKKPMRSSRGAKDIYLLARLINGEARGESYQGQVAVGAVIMNRIKSGRFPKTIADNIFKKGEFESVSNGQIWKTLTSSSLKAARAAVSGLDPTRGALFFYNPTKIRNKNSWIWSRKTIKRIGRHIFAV